MSAAALVVFAHGARDPAWAAPVEALAARLRARQPERIVRCAYLERLEPTLDCVLDALAQDEVAEVAVLPVFWAAAGHVEATLPAAVARLGERGVRVRVLPVLSALPGLLEAIAEQADRLA